MQMVQDIHRTTFRDQESRGNWISTMTRKKIASTLAMTLVATAVTTEGNMTSS